MIGLNRLWPQTGASSKGMTPDEAAVLREVLVHDQAESRRLRRIQQAAEWAKNQDIPLEILSAFDRPFPGNNFSVTNLRDGKSGMGTLGKLAIGAALATGIGGLGLGALSLLKPAQQVEKIIPGVDTETIITPGEIIVE